MGFVALHSVAERGVRVAHAKTQRRKENQSFFGFGCGPELRLFATPLILPGGGKRLVDEVGKHSQFVFCEQHGVRGELFVVGSSGSCRTQQRGTRTPRSSTRTRTHRNQHRNDDRQIVAY